MKKDKYPSHTKKKEVGTMNVILAIVGILLTLFTAKMIDVYEKTGSIPETLCASVFATLGGECGIMGWIKTTKDKSKEREWLIEDRNEEREKRQEE